jgi:alpha-L-fucosidase 2
MLIQSHEGDIHLLPALPAAWPTGQVKGLRARGGYEVDMAWKSGRLESAVIRAKFSGSCRIRYAGKKIERTIRAGSFIKLNGDLKNEK